MNRLILIALFAAISTSGIAQNKYDDMIRLKNGSIIYGTIIENVVDDHLKILIGGRQTLEFDYEEIVQIKDGSFRMLISDQHKRGYFNETQLGLALGKSSDFSETVPYISVHTLNGYRWHRLISTGVGIGYDSYEPVNMMPVFLGIRGDLFKSRVTPFYLVDVGFSTAWASSIGGSNLESADGGRLFNAGIGLKIHGLGKSWVISTTFKNQKADLNYFDWWWGGEVVEERSFRNMTIKVGLTF